MDIQATGLNVNFLKNILKKHFYNKLIFNITGCSGPFGQRGLNVPILLNYKVCKNISFSKCYETLCSTLLPRDPSPAFSNKEATSVETMTFLGVLLTVVVVVFSSLSSSSPTMTNPCS